MRIGVLAPPWVSVPPPRYGGVETVVDALAVGYQAAGHDVRLFTVGDSTCPVPKLHLYDEAAEGDPAGAPITQLVHAMVAPAGSPPAPPDRESTHLNSRH